MRRWGGGWLHSSRDLLAVLECDHRLQLEHVRTSGLLCRPESENDSTLDLVAEHGHMHEHGALAALQALVDRRGGHLVSIADPKNDDDVLRLAVERTEQALAAQVDVVHQAALLVNGFLGFADFLVSIDLEKGTPLVDEATGRRRYEPVDAKLARSAKPSALLQAAAYADALIALGHPAPKSVHLWLGTGKVISSSAADLLPLVAEYRERALAQLDTTPAVPVPAHGDARTACGSCAWKEHCDDGRRAARDLSLVAGIRRDQIHKLRDHHAGTVELLATASDDQRPRGMGRHTFHKLRAQASLQVEGEGAPLPVVDVFAPAVLEALPAPDAGDLYYDIEGDPFAEGGEGLEYLHGVTDVTGAFTAEWAHSPDEEKLAVQRIVDRLTAAAAAHPGMHVYHYADYERSALKRLAQQHSTRIEEVDQLLRDGRLVNLYAVVRRSVRVSTESYSIKKLEPLFMGERLRTGVTNAGDSIIEYEKHLAQKATGDRESADLTLKAIEDYNAYDCEATLELHRWLLDLVGRDPLPSSSGTAASAAPTDVTVVKPPSEATLLAERLLDGVPTDQQLRTPHQQALALLAAAVGYHEREAKPAWWEHYTQVAMTLSEMEEDDGVVLLQDVVTGPWSAASSRSMERREVSASTSSTPADVKALGSKPIAIYEVATAGCKTSAETGRALNSRIEHVSGRVTFTEGAGAKTTRWDDVPVALIPGTPVANDNQRAVLRSLAVALLNSDDEPSGAWWKLLRRTPPAVTGGLPRTGDAVADVTSALRFADEGVLSVQGPPGTGKTYVGSRVIAGLAASGWRIGVVAQSHKVVETLLREVVAVDPAIAVGKKAKSTGAAGSPQGPPWTVCGDAATWLAQQAGGCVLGGTTWDFAAPAVRAERFDLVVVEEAGQYSLPDALVVASATRRVLLLGDPQQLPQVTQGTHVEPVDVSAMQHVMGAAPVMPPAHGYTLTTTWRMHPEVCAPVSRLQYDGVLHSHLQCAERSLDGVAPGVHLVEVDHAGNRTSSLEEVGVVVDRVCNLLGRTWCDEQAAPRPLAQEHLLVVAPFNRQVTAIQEGLRAAGLDDVEVGTVDKFQGREAPVVIVSMATSSGEDLPRGVEFLLSRNRLNVAISRAKWAAYLIHSPALRRLTPTSTAGMSALGAFLGVLRRR